MSEDSNLTVRVRRKQMIGFLTCPICKDLFEDPMNITECLHIFCKKCIINKITEEDLSNCPVCSVDLGCAPLDKLRPDHNWNSIRSVLLPSLRNEDDDYVFVEKEGMELDQVVNVEPLQSVVLSTTPVLANVAAAQPEVPPTTPMLASVAASQSEVALSSPVLANVAVAQSDVPSSTTVLANVAAAQSEVPSTPVLDRVLHAEQSEAPYAPMLVRTKGRSPSNSTLSTLLVPDDDTMRVTRSKSNAKKLLFANDQSSMSPEKLHKSMDDRAEGSNISTSPLKVAKSNENVSRSKSPLKIVASNVEKVSRAKSPLKIVASNSETVSRSKSPFMTAKSNEKMGRSKSPSKIAEINEKANTSKSLIIKIAQRNEKANRSKSPMKDAETKNGKVSPSKSSIKMAEENEKADMPTKCPIKDAEGNEKTRPSKTLTKIAEGNEKVYTFKSPTTIAERNEKVNPSPTKIARGKEKANKSKSPLKIVESNEEVILSPPIKIAESNEKSSKQKEVTKDKGSTQSMPLEDMSDMLTPLIYLLKAAADKKKSVKLSAGHGLVSNATKIMGKREAKDSGNTSKNCDKADDAIVGSIPPPPVPAKPKQNRRGRPRKVRPPKELTIPPQLIIDTARDKLLKRANPIWFTFVASKNQEGDAPLPQVPRCFVSVKDVKLPVVYIKKYLVQKLNLENEDEVEIFMWGEPLPPSLHLKSLIELWTHTTPPSERLITRVGESAEDFVMVITYARKAPPKPANSIPK